MRPKFISLILREYQQAVRRKAFLISTAILPLFFLLVTVLPQKMMEQQESAVRMEVLDQTGETYTPLAESLQQQKLKDGSAKFELSRFEPEAVPAGELIEAGKERVRTRGTDAFLVLPEDFADTGKSEYYTLSVTDFQTQSRVRNAMTELLRKTRLEARGLDESEIQQALGWASMETHDLRPKKTGESAQSTIQLAIGAVMLLYMTLLLYGTSIMMNVIEEKTTRVFEVMLSCVPAWKIMAGKVAGVGMACLTQYAIWTVVLILLSQGREMPYLEGLTIPPMLVIQLGALLLLGFLLYGFLYAAVGAICSSVQDAQQVQWPILSFLILPMVLMAPLLIHPNGVLAVALSLFPMTSPVVMPLRLSAASPSDWQVAACYALLACAAGLAIYASGRVFRAGIMVHTSRPKLGVILRWIRAREV